MDTGKRALPFDAKVTEAEGNTDKIYQLEIETATGTITTPNLRGTDGEKYVVPTLDHEPGESDLTWTADGVAHPFEIGYMCRWLDPDRGDSGEYLFYQLNDITADGKAIWKRAGSGGGDGETVTLTLSTSDGKEEALMGQKLTLRYGNVSTELDWDGEPIQFTVPATQYYWIEWPDVEGYLTPAVVHHTAGAGTVREMAARYELITVSSLIFDKATYLPANITGDVNQGIYKDALDTVRRCLAKPEADGAAICYLNDGDTTQYHDGTGAALDGSEGDVMVFLPGSYLRHVNPDVDHVRYDIARQDPHGAFLLHDTDSLIGAYKASYVDGLLRSVSGVTPVTDIGRYDLHQLAVGRGEGFRLIDFRQHCTLALLCYAKFGTRDIRSVIGAGTATWNADNLTGSTNALGIGETSGEVTGYVSALGVEGIIGGVSELMDGVEALDYLWKIERPDGSIEEVAACREIGWIASMAFEAGPRFDMVPTLIGGSSSAYYADFYECADNDFVPMAVARACFTNAEFPDDGVAYANATLTPYTGSPFFGTRLAYRGNIRVVDDPAEFKAI